MEGREREEGRATLGSKRGGAQREKGERGEKKEEREGEEKKKKKEEKKKKVEKGGIHNGGKNFVACYPIRVATLIDFGPFFIRVAALIDFDTLFGLGSLPESPIHPRCARATVSRNACSIGPSRSIYVTRCSSTQRTMHR